MAIDYIPYTTGTPWQSRLINAVRNVGAARTELQIVLDKMNRMNDDADFSALESEFGIEAGKGDDARNELASYLAKVQTDASVSAVKTALDQLVAKLG